MTFRGVLPCTQAPRWHSGGAPGEVDPAPANQIAGAPIVSAVTAPAFRRTPDALPRPLSRVPVPRSVLHAEARARSTAA